MPLHLFYRYGDRECNPNFDEDFDCHPFPNPATTLPVVIPGFGIHLISGVLSIVSTFGY
jgi:hypothetical protein